MKSDKKIYPYAAVVMQTVEEACKLPGTQKVNKWQL